jgi:cytidylate kinase
MAVITISRQFGSGGTDIAASICEKLNYRYLDKLLMNQVATELGLFDLELAEISETHYKVRHFLDRILFPGPHSFAQFSVRPRDVDEPEARRVLRLDEARCANLVRSAILAAYQAGNAVIVGRGGQAVLRDKPDVFHVRIQSPLEDRIRRVQRRQVIDHSQALDMIQHYDEISAQYLSSLFGIDWEDLSLYHLILNTARISQEAAVEVVIAGVAHLPELPQKASPTRPETGAH